MEHFSSLYASASVTLLGFGRSGEAVLPTLLACGARVTVRDRRSLPDTLTAPYRARGVRFITGHGYLDGLCEEVIFRSPVIRPDLPALKAAVARGARLTGEYDEFARLTPALRLGVTGSDGKTTTATLAARMLEEDTHNDRHIFLGGNIGVPLFPLLPQMRTGDLAVLELSSFQLMSAPLPPTRAVITNITQNHLNWHTDMAEYTAAKECILGADTVPVLNADNATTAAMARIRPDSFVFSSHRDKSSIARDFPHCHRIYIDGLTICADGVPLLPLEEIRLPGRHNIENYMAAIGLVLPYLEDREAVRRVARSFYGVPHRLELVGEESGVLYYNSSIDSTPTRTAAALSALNARPILLCGGRGKGLSLAPLARAVQTHAKAVILFGESREALCEALRDCGVPLLSASTMKEAFFLAKDMARTGDTVLLSPACTSFDEFTDFNERGECFRRLVKGVVL